MKINSRAKGKTGEKLAINFLQEWTGMKFVRVPASGGLRWKTTNNTVGDVICDEPNYILPISVESKFVRDINFEHLLYHRGNKRRRLPRIREFWKQACDDAKRGKKRPFLMMRYNGLPKDVFFVVIGYNDFEALKDLNRSLDPYLQLSRLFYIIPSRSLQNIPWDEFEDVMHSRIKKVYGKKTK